MGLWKPAGIGAACGASVGAAAMAAWYFLFPPGAPAQYFVASTGPEDRFATLYVDGALVVRIVVLFSCLGAATLVGLTILRTRIPQRRRFVFEATSIVGLWTLAGAAVTAVVYQVGHRFVSSRSPGHWPSFHYDYLVPLMPVVGLLVGLLCAALWLAHARRKASSTKPEVPGCPETV
jgi:hypothetical protein